MHFVEDLSDSMHQERPSDGFLFELVFAILVLQEVFSWTSAQRHQIEHLELAT